ncbi:hypothetical protein AVEN_54569-1 [Araneus ventricosus]|uniref:Uncharacterized protein n=1 Tax=Araneus ventricosus TaxID=182803 RepID=A0A4Y2BKY1_ARAVE|nr:hypothetical protein AVEN_54569-1 [Araneus ventricosus]
MPADLQVVVRNYLNTSFTERRIERGGPLTRWSPRSPDLSIIDYFLWGHLKATRFEFQLTQLRTSLLDYSLRLQVCAYKTATTA